MEDYHNLVKNQYILDIGMQITYMVRQCHKSFQ